MAAADIPPDVLSRILSLLLSARDTAAAMAVCRTFLAAGKGVVSLRFWFSRAAKDMDCGAQNLCDSFWLGSSADTFITALISNTHTLSSLEIICTDGNIPCRHPSVTWTGFPSSTVLPWLRHLQPTLEVLHFDNFRLTPEAEMSAEGDNGDADGGANSDSDLSRSWRFGSIVNLISKARGASTNVLRRSGGSCDLGATKPHPMLRKSGGSADLSHLRDSSGAASGPSTSSSSSSTSSSSSSSTSSSSSRGGSPLRGPFSYLRRAASNNSDFFAFYNPTSISNSVSNPVPSAACEGSGGSSRFSNVINMFSKGRSSSEPSTPRANSPSLTDRERNREREGEVVEDGSSNTERRTQKSTLRPEKYHLSLIEMLRELDGGRIQKMYVSRVSLLQSFSVPFFLPSLSVLHITKPTSAPASGSLNTILSACYNLSELCLSDMDGPDITPSSYSLTSESLKVLRLNKVCIGALKLSMLNLRVLDFLNVKPLMTVLIEAETLEVLRVRECGNVDKREELHVIGPTKLEEIDIDATSINYFNSALSMVRTAGDMLRKLRVNVIPPVLPANIFEMAMEIPDLQSVSIGRDVWEALLRGRGEVKWAHFDWGRIQALQIDFGVPQFAALYLLHDLVLRCSGLQSLVIRCVSKESYAWIQSPMHEYLDQNCPQVDLHVELLRGKECFSLEAMAA